MWISVCVCVCVLTALILSMYYTVRLFNQGIDIVEVSDDGCGIPAASRPFVATAHATSKIRSFQDIYDNGHGQLTMGFRGEALFCLSNLSSNVIVATRTANEELAQKLEFRRDGSLNLAAVASIPRKVGTTVAVVRLLESLPVRRADMIRRISNQRGRLMRMMVGYAIFSVGVRINLMDMVVSGGGCRENALLATTFNSTSIQETISSVLGSKFLASLCSIFVDLTSAVTGSSNDFGEEGEAVNSNDKPKWKMEGLVAKALYSRDRGTRDGQFFSINARPVEIPKVAKLLNEAWRTFGGQKRPSCVLQFTLPNDAFDINLSPDKRQVMLTYEKEICDLVQEGVTKLWASQTEGKFTANVIDGMGSASQQQEEDDADRGDNVPEYESPTRFNRRYAFSHDFSKAKLQHEFDDGRRVREEAEVMNPAKEQATKATERAAAAREAITDIEEAEKQQIATTEEEEEAEQQKRTEAISTKKTSNITTYDTPSPENNVRQEKAVVELASNADQSTDADRQRWKLAQQTFNNTGSAGLEDEIQTVKKMDFDLFRASGDSVGTNQRAAAPSLSDKTLSLEQHGFQVASTPARPLPTTTKRATSGTAQETAPISKRSRVGETRSPSPSEDNDADNANDAEEHAVNDEMEANSPKTSEPGSQPQSTVVWDIFTGTGDVVQAARTERLAMRDRKREFQGASRERSTADIWDEPTTEGQGESGGGCTISLSKQDFNSMTVIGQFNLGFILARDGKNHLWILDQHACDEKYNFEKLCAETVIHEQKLIAPMPLELSPSEEACVLDHMETFEKNGFRFAYDSDKPPRHRFALTALPHSGARDGRKAVQFGKDDVSALCAILGADGSGSSYGGAAGAGSGADGSGMYGNNAVRRYAGNGAGDTADKIIARLPKAIAMFASRACRGSIMIGKPLSSKEMDRIVKRLVDVEHPWNCPHGRPTMRHVGDVAHLMLDDERKAAGHIAGPTVTIMSQEEEQHVESQP